MKVLGARCIVKEEKREETGISGIIIPNKTAEPSYRGKVVSVGEGAMLDNGLRVPMDVSVGDDVIYTTFSGSPVNVNGEEYVILNERDILCIL